MTEDTITWLLGWAILFVGVLIIVFLVVLADYSLQTKPIDGFVPTENQKYQCGDIVVEPISGKKGRITSVIVRNPARYEVKFFTSDGLRWITFEQYEIESAKEKP